MNWSLVIGILAGVALGFLIIVFVYVLGTLGTQRKLLLQAEADNAGLRNQVLVVAKERDDIHRRPYVIHFTDEQVLRMAAMVRDACVTLHESENGKAN